MNQNVISVRASDGSVVKFETHSALQSTVKLARHYAKIGYPDRYVVFAESRKRIDDSQKRRAEGERGIYMSCILRPSIFPSQAALISSLAAVAAVSALEEHTEKDMGIGWVSKIYCEGKFIGDITIEGKLDNFTTYEYMIITFSLVLDEKNFPDRLTDLVKKVFETEHSSVSAIIAKNILNKFLPLYVNIKNNNKFMDVYDEKFILRGQKIRYLKDGKRHSCRVIGINRANGSLVAEDSGKNTIYISTPNSVVVPKKINTKK